MTRVVGFKQHIVGGAASTITIMDLGVGTFVTQRGVCDALTRAMREATRLAAEGMHAVAHPDVESGWSLAAATEDRVMLTRLVCGFHFTMSFHVVHEGIMVSHVQLVIRDGCHLTLRPSYDDPTQAALEVFGLTIAASQIESTVLPLDLTHAEAEASLAFLSVIAGVVKKGGGALDSNLCFFSAC